AESGGFGDVVADEEGVDAVRVDGGEDAEDRPADACQCSADDDRGEEHLDVVVSSRAPEGTGLDLQPAVVEEPAETGFAVAALDLRHRDPVRVDEFGSVAFDDVRALLDEDPDDKGEHSETEGEDSADAGEQQTQRDP